MRHRFANKKGLLDGVVIAGMLLLAGVLYLVLNLNRQEGGVAVVRVNGVETARFSLSENGSFSLNGGSNTLLIRDGQAWISEADCPDRICVKSGKIHLTGQVITCLPNRLTVTVEGGEPRDVDVVAGRNG